MKFKRTVFLTIAVIVMGLLSISSQAATVLFEGNTATGIKDLEYNGVFYDVTFVFQTGNSLYGPKGEGDFPFAGLEGEESAANEEATYGAGRAIQEALNAASQAITRVGPQAVNYFLIAGGEENTDPGNPDTPWVYAAFASAYYDDITTEKRSEDTWVPADTFFLNIDLQLGGGWPPIKIEGEPWPFGMMPPLAQDVSYSWAKIEPAAGSPPPTDTTVGGSVTGLEGTGLVLQNNGADDQPIPADGAFTFNTLVTPGMSYSVTVKTQPSNPAQKCTVAQGWGTVPDGGVDDVLVTCTLPPPRETDQEGIEDLVTRFYNVCLGRDPDSEGFNGWVNGLISGETTACQLSFGFFFSPEYLALNTSNEVYVDDLYETHFNRLPDPAGKAGWLDVLNSGVSREDVLNGFVFSPEFVNMAADLGIIVCE